jgi:sugar-phosphatase
LPTRGGSPLRRSEAKTDGVSAVLFDLDGVLVDTTQLVERYWRRWAREQNLPPGDVLAVVHGRLARDVVRMFMPDHDVEQEALRIQRSDPADSAEIHAIPGARECVNVARRGRWAVVTSGERETATGRLAAVALPIPEVLVTADDVTLGKPDPEPYERAARELAVPASGCVVIEDSPAGITAAKRAGMTVFAVTTTHAASSLGEADCLFQSMREVRQRLSAISL